MIHAFDTAQRLEEDVGLQGVVHTAGGLRGDLTAGVRDFKQFLLADRIRAFGGLTDGFVGESVGVRDGASMARMTACQNGMPSTALGSHG